MNLKQALGEPSFRAKIMGSVLIAIGVYLIIFQAGNVFINIGFGAIFIGLFAIIVITEKSIPKKIYDAQIESNIEFIRSLIYSLGLKGNGIYIPISENLSKERIFIPVYEEESYELPVIDDETVFITGTSGSSLGFVFIPPGLGLMELYEREMNIKFKDFDFEELAKYLQIMIHGLNIIKDLSIKKINDSRINLIITKTADYNVCEKIVGDMDNLCRQTGCPICSSILCAITRSFDRKIKIEHVDIKDGRIYFTLKIGE